MSPVDDVSVMTALGTVSLGVVAAFTVAARIAREWSAQLRARLSIFAWALVLMAGVIVDVIYIAGPAAMLWLATGMVTGSLMQMCVHRYAKRAAAERMRG